MAAEEKEDEESDAGGQARPEIGVVKGAGRKTRPPVVPGREREDDGEETESENCQKHHPRRPDGIHFSLPSRRRRTKAITVSARAGGISAGFSIFRHLPVAR